ncbi:MAG: hypothetical protein V4675_05045 [Verrucomicrobiota bacterium]
MKRSFPLSLRASLWLALAALPAAAPAAVTVTGLSSFDSGSGRYTYNYSVTNADSAEELIQVTFPVSASAALLGLTAPAGFKLTYDTIGARVNFVWDDDDFTMQTFAPDSTVSGFSFTSPVGPGLTPFIASDISQDYTGFTAAPVPEPSVLMLGLLAPLALLRRRRA